MEEIKCLFINYNYYFWSKVGQITVVKNPLSSFLNKNHHKFAVLLRICGGFTTI